jgi:hypothetical protein
MPKDEARIYVFATEGLGIRMIPSRSAMSLVEAKTSIRPLDGVPCLAINTMP